MQVKLYNRVCPVFGMCCQNRGGYQTASVLSHKLPVCTIPNAQSGSERDKKGYRPDAKRIGISRHISRAIGEIRGVPKAVCSMMRTFDLAIIRVQTDK